jgi:hypothetical protein
MKYPDENVVFNCTVDNGRFYYKKPSPPPGPNIPSIEAKNISAQSGHVVNWMEHEIEGPSATHAFIEIVLKLEENIIGYVVIEAYRVTGLNYSANILHSALIPKVDGEYQAVTEEQVKAAIEKIKENV